MIIKTKFKDLVIIQNKSFKDDRGYFKELLREKEINKKFPFMVMSYSKKNVLRGLHIQSNHSQGKYVSVLKGKIETRTHVPRFQTKLQTLAPT